MKKSASSYCEVEQDRNAEQQPWFQTSQTNVRSQNFPSRPEQLHTVHSLNWAIAHFIIVDSGVLDEQNRVGPAGRMIFASHDLHDDRSETELPDPLVRLFAPQQTFVRSCYSSKSRQKRG
jgi:hypothetical protein